MLHVGVLDGVLLLLNLALLVLAAWWDVLGLDVDTLHDDGAELGQGLDDCPLRALVLAGNDLQAQGYRMLVRSRLSPS